MAAQSYTSSGNISTGSTSIVTTYPLEQGGGTMAFGSAIGITGSSGASGAPASLFSSGINPAELNSDVRLGTSGAVGVTNADSPDMYAELQNFISLFTRVQTTGLSQVAFNSVGIAGPGTGTSYTPSLVMTPRAVLFRLQQMVNAMLSQPNVV